MSDDIAESLAQLIRALECDRLERLLESALRLDGDPSFSPSRRGELRRAVMSLRAQLAEARR